MKAISLHQPWASAIAITIKQNETRSRRAIIRGRIAIHAAQRRDRDLRLTFEEDFLDIMEVRFAFKDVLHHSFDTLPFGAIIATADLFDCVPSDPEYNYVSHVEHSLGNYAPGRWVWKLRNVQRLKKPIPFKGRQGWFEVPDSLLSEHNKSSARDAKTA